MDRIVVDLGTGKKTIVPLTPAEEADAAARTAAEQIEQLTEQAKAKLADIDLRSIRAIREYIAAKPDAPQVLKDREAEAAAERAKLK